MQLDLSDKVVVVSGGGRGIGHTLVERLRSEGCRVTALDVEFPPESNQDDVSHLQCDVTDEASVRAAIDNVVIDKGAWTCSSTTLASTPRGWSRNWIQRSGGGVWR
jgi:NAD(P)-dependent dehydrogenase (short-subunit alcohol dehydrogenase family)